MDHVLHVGLEKTGTTSLQKYIFDNLEDEVCYLGKYSSKKECYEPLKATVRGERDPSEVRQKVMTTLNQTRNNEQLVLWSCAKLAHAQLADHSIIARRLRDVIGDATVLFTVRRQEELCVSQYFNFVSRGSCDYENFDQFLTDGITYLSSYNGKDKPKRIVRQPGYGRELWAIWTVWQYQTLIKQWKKVFDNVVVLPLEAWKQQRQVTERFLSDLLQVDQEKIEIPERKARSRTDNLVKHAVRVIPGTERVPGVHEVASYLRDITHSGGIPDIINDFVSQNLLTKQLSESQLNSIEEVFGPENRGLSPHTEFDLDSLGYLGYSK